MTAEIAILNRSAVALAADSAVTISTPTGPKIFESVNKLFALVKQQPVGIMIYDSADLLGVPWETVIKAYRMERRGKAFGVLDEYAADFLNFITATPELLPKDLHDLYFEESIRRRLGILLDEINQEVMKALNAGERLAQQKIRDIVNVVLTAEESQWEAQPDGGWIATADLDRLEKRWRERVDALIVEIFQELPLTATQRKRLRVLLVGSLGKEPYWHNGSGSPVDPQSGIVIAGFGEKEYFPRLLSFDISGVVDGHLRVKPNHEVAITADNLASVVPFAQRDMVDGFFSGINPAVERSVDAYWGAVEQTLPDGVLQLLRQHVPGVDDAAASALAGPLRSLMAMTIRELETHLNRLKGDQVTPILNSVIYLPKDELAAMAESLVNLTSLKRRVSIDDPQTVGGPVDVAVISRGDGFVWIKRKHYFTQELNPSWAGTHAEG